MTTRREKSKPQKPQINKQLEPIRNKESVGKKGHSIAFEAGKFCLDIAKLVFGGVILAGIMQQGIESNSLFLTGLGVVLLFVVFGFYLIKKSNKKTIGDNNYDTDILFPGCRPYRPCGFHRFYHLLSSSRDGDKRKLKHPLIDHVHWRLSPL